MMPGDDAKVGSPYISASQRPSVTASQIDWHSVKRVLVVRLRSIGDTVLATPALTALRRFLPGAEIDILLEDWVAPLLDGFDGVNVISVGRGNSDRIKTALKLRKRRYDVGFNLHGGTTATMLLRASGARHRVGYANYQYPFLYNHLVSSSADFWNTETTHSAEQQLALLGHVGIPVDDRPKSSLPVSDLSLANIDRRIDRSAIALVHPAAAFDTKQWPTENFARTAEYLTQKGFAVVAVTSKPERPTLDELIRSANVPITIFDDLSLPELAALAKRSAIFVGNDSGVAHIAAAVGTPTVVIFGSSNRAHWHPWTDAPNAVVYRPFDCQPCPGYTCAAYDEPRCILTVPVMDVTVAIDTLV